MNIGIPRALFYHKYGRLWESFFQALGIGYTLSPDTNKDIMARGMNYAVDESCLSSKIYLGHVDWLREHSDRILVPRISNWGKAGIVCTKHQALYDMVKNTFRDGGISLLHYNIDLKNNESEMGAFLKLGLQLGKGRAKALLAYMSAKQAEKAAQDAAIAEQERLLETRGIRILIIAHAYNIHDKLVGQPVIDGLRSLGVAPILGDIVRSREAIAASVQLSETLPWVSNKELLGSIALHRDRVDGILLMSTFPCGPDSLVDEIIIRRVKDKPILNLILDGQEGTGGLETRLESFVDIIKYKRSENAG
jgi:predicted nucleotide-binding protein (sugar kinase/HSP70/actin superfamily)